MYTTFYNNLHFIHFNFLRNTLLTYAKKFNTYLHKIKYKQVLQHEFYGNQTIVKILGTHLNINIIKTRNRRN